jgi:hypothetical protein
MSLAGAAREVSEHASALARLELELARREVGRRATRLAVGLAIGLLAAVLAVLALGFALAAAASGLDAVLPQWAAILVVAGAALLVTIVLGLIAASLLRRGVPVPEQALAEARLTMERLRETDGDGRGD